MILNSTFFCCLLQELHCCRYTQVEVQILQVCAGCTGTGTRGMERTRKNRKCVRYSISDPEFNIGFFQRKKDTGNLCKSFKNLSNKIVVVKNLYNLSHFYGVYSPVDGLLLVYATSRQSILANLPDFLQHSHIAKTFRSSQPF